MLPDFDDLPTVEGMPQGCAWGIFDKDGKKDKLGTLNLLIPEVVLQAVSEIQLGESVSLNWPIGAIHEPQFGRIPLEHKTISFFGTHGVHAFDDEVQFNTQASSQWDSLCHYGHQPTGLFYNGAKPSLEDPESKDLPTLENWHNRGGLVARGVLLDYKAYADAHGISYSPFERHEISLADLQAVAKSQGTTFRAGDVLIVRTGFTEALQAQTKEEQHDSIESNMAVGVAGSEDVARWVWNNHFAAVAGDAIGFEVIPPVPGGVKNFVLHQYFLCCFGLPIGELFDLKALSAKCAQLKRWTFFLTSVPLNIPGSIGSPPNALAIF